MLGVALAVVAGPIFVVTVSIVLGTLLGRCLMVGPGMVARCVQTAVVLGVYVCRAVLVLPTVQGREQPDARDSHGDQPGGESACGLGGPAAGDGILRTHSQ